MSAKMSSHSTLNCLSIKNIVLIDQLHLEFENGLCALTGETGAGKSILLDALGLALGMRAEARLVRKGKDQASVTAEFHLSDDHIIHQVLKDQDLESEDTLILRRSLSAEGKSRAFINDQPVSIGLLKQIGSLLVEIHGQFETQGLLDPKTHRHVLDSYGGLNDNLAEIKSSWDSWQTAEAARQEAAETITKNRQEEEYLAHAVAELDKLSPEADEEEKLSELRSILMHSEQLVEAVGKSYAQLTEDNGTDQTLNSALAALDRLADKAGGRLDPVLESLNRCAADLSDAISELQRLSSGFGPGDQNLDDIEERLFALKDCARKHQCEISELPALRDKLAADLNLIENSEETLAELTKQAEKAKNTYVTTATTLHEKRHTVAKRLDKAITAELPPLKLDKAQFNTTLETLDETRWGPTGISQVTFEVSTNPGSAPGPIHKIASGGELARFMLALKAVVAETDQISTLVFDEVDSGVSGAVSDAVGDRLAQLGEQFQVMVVTHSPQVAARAKNHWIVSKTEQDGQTKTNVRPISDTEKREEIARMLSGANITAEARAAAEKLIEAA